MTLTQLFQRFLAHKRATHRSEQTLTSYESDFFHFRLWLKTSRLHDTLGSFRFEVLEQYQAYLEQFHYAARTTLRRLHALSSFGRWLVVHEVLRANPLDRLEKPKKPKTLPRILGPEEIHALLALPVSLKWAAIRAVLCYAGLRRSEVINLDLRDVNLDRGLLHVRGKGAKDRLVPMAAPVEVALRTYLPERAGRGPEDALFPGDITLRIRKASLAETLRKWGRAIGRPDLRPHLLRHTFLTQLVAGGRSLKEAQEIAGHEDIGTTQQYVHLSQDHLIQAMQGFSYDRAPRPRQEDDE